MHGDPGACGGAGACTACRHLGVHSPLAAQVDAAGWVVVVAAAFLANTAESFVGATLQGRLPWLNNDVVNALQITLAALLALLLRTLM